MKKLITILLLLLLAGFTFAKDEAPPTYVGNGDDGADLEGFRKVTSGKLITSKRDAIKLLKRLNIAGVVGLGVLIPELESSRLYIAKKNLSTKRLEEMGAYETSRGGFIYARTFPRPHAPVRFFPIAKTLDNRQLIALHIHEALHRSLPRKYRENEKIATMITLSIASPESSFDNVNETVKKCMPDLFQERVRDTNRVAGHSKLKRPTQVGLGIYQYKTPKKEDRSRHSFPVKQLFTFSGRFYPIQFKKFAFGAGVDLSLIRTAKDTIMGPLGLSAHFLVWTMGKFDFEVFGKIILNTLSEDEVQYSMLGEDIFRIGGSMDRKSEGAYIGMDYENTFRRDAGMMHTIRVRGGRYYGKFHFGGFGEIHIGKRFSVINGTYRAESGENRILAIGPSIYWQDQKNKIELMGKWLVDASKDANFDQLGDLTGAGVGQGNIGIKFSYFF